MPVIKSAKKKLRVDKKRQSDNKKVKSLIDMFIKKVEKNPTPKNMQKAFSIIDKGVKKKIFHKNKGSRIKSRLSKLISKKTETDKSKTVTKPTIGPSKAKKTKRAAK